MGSCQSTSSAVQSGSPKASAASAVSPLREQPCINGTSPVTSQSSTTTASHHGDPNDDDDENPKILVHQPSPVGLDAMVEERKSTGHLVSNVVNLETLRQIDQVYDNVQNGRILGEGVAGRVRLVTHKETGIPYAVKELDLKRFMTPEGHQEPSTLSFAVAQYQLRNEITIMSQLDHPNIARLQEVYEDGSYIYLVQELGEGGELFDILEEQPDYHYKEEDAVRLVCQMLSALRYLHSKGIVHRDLKLENFLFSTQRHAQLKMIDFGLSKHFDHVGEIQHETVGSPYTVAPEVIEGSYDEKCDLWAIGVLTFMLLCGETPFGGCGGPESPYELRSNILAGRYSFEPEDIWATVSAPARDFVRTLLVTNPRKRPSAEEAQRHPWIRAHHEARIDQATLDPKLIRSLKAFKDLPVTKRLMLEVVSFTMLQDQIKDIQVEFEKMDTNGLGEISLNCMIQVLSRGRAVDAVDADDADREQAALSESEIEEIFDSMKVGKSEPRVHWHEFVAACLPACRVDDRNLRIAFDRLDQDHNGFVTFEEAAAMIARDANEDKGALMQAWTESVEELHCEQSQFSFEDFSRLVHIGSQDALKTTVNDRSRYESYCGRCWVGNTTVFRIAMAHFRRSCQPMVGAVKLLFA